MHVIETGKIRVFTFKEGFLSAVAHDLCLELRRFRVQIDGARLLATFWPSTLVVVGVMQEGRCDEGELGEQQKREIVENIRSKVLKVDDYPEASLEAALSARQGGVTLTGQLSLVGLRQAIVVDARIAEGSVCGQVELEPSRWSIAPFRALLGAIRLQDRVLVRFELAPPAGVLAAL